MYMHAKNDQNIPSDLKVKAVSKTDLGQMDMA